MLRYSWTIHLFLLVALLFAIAAACQTTADIKLVFAVGTLAQSDAPVSIVGLKMPSKIAGHPTVVFRNTSTKSIERVIFAAGIANARSLRAGDLVYGKNVLFVVPSVALSRAVHIEPGSQGEYESLPFSTSYISMAARLGTACIRVAPFVQKVTFSDGTEWSPSFDDMVHAWLHASSQGAPLACESVTDMPGGMSNLRSSRFHGSGQSTHADQHLVSHYQYECSLPPGGELATCPF